LGADTDLHHAFCQQVRQFQHNRQPNCNSHAVLDESSVMSDMFDKSVAASAAVLYKATSAIRWLKTPAGSGKEQISKTAASF
jgi:uncharacterized protein (DUF58 family)